MRNKPALDNGELGDGALRRTNRLKKMPLTLQFPDNVSSLRNTNKLTTSLITFSSLIVYTVRGSLYVQGCLLSHTVHNHLQHPDFGVRYQCTELYLRYSKHSRTPSVPILPSFLSYLTSLSPSRLFSPRVRGKGRKLFFFQLPGSAGRADSSLPRRKRFRTILLLSTSRSRCVQNEEVS